MNQTLNFAVVGCGVISRLHLTAIRDLPEAGLAGVFDTNREAAERTARAWNTRTYATYDELLADEGVDAVCLCVPSFLHTPLAMQAIQAGKHVLIEKPLALSLEECDALTDLANRKGCRVGVVSQLRFYDGIKQVKNLLEQGRLGRITRADLYMKYYRSQAYYDSGAWRGTWEKDGGGGLMNQGIHGVDLLLYLMGPVKEIYAMADTMVHNIEVEDTLSAAVRFESGPIGVIEASTGDWPGSPRRLEINGERGRVILEEDRVVLLQVEGEEDYQEPRPQEGSTATFSDPGGVDPAGHRAQMKNFIHAVRGEEPLLVDTVQGRAAVKLILSAYRSARTGLPVRLDAEPDQA